MRRRREQWQELVSEWEASGATASDFARRRGVNELTLRHWKWRLGSDARTRRTTTLAQIVEVRPSLTLTDERFEVQVAGGRCVRVPASFDDGALQRLLRVLEATS